MKALVYRLGGMVALEDFDEPKLTPGSILVQTEACGICTGELMTWYMDKKAPHVIGHEVCGKIIASDQPDFPVGKRVFAHHHGPCMTCNLCKRGAFVHCPQWKRSKLIPGGMAEIYKISPENLSDTFLIDDLTPQQGALIEPIACVLKCIQRARVTSEDNCLVIGAGALGIVHALALDNATIFDNDPSRLAFAKSLGIADHTKNQDQKYTKIFVCPGFPEAIDFAINRAEPDATIALFAPIATGESLPISAGEHAYMNDLTFVNSYSCGPDDCQAAYELLQSGKIRPNQIISDFVKLEQAPKAYQDMKEKNILKAMVLFGQ